MDTVFCKEVIISTIKRRGLGTELSPVRIITEVYEKDGTLIAEKDPCPEIYTTTDLIHFARQCASESKEQADINIRTVENWSANLKLVLNNTQALNQPQ